MKRRIFLYSLLAYLPFVLFLGFYSDDLFFGYVGHFLGPQGIIDSLTIDRPLIGYLYAFLFQLLGDSPLNWHFYSLIVRLIGGFLLYFSLSKIWPRNKPLFFTATLLFLLYPGFLQQPLSLGYAPWHTNLTLWFLSLFFTVLSLNNTGKLSIFYSLWAVIIQILTLLFIEFFVGLEILRFALIIYLLGRKSIKQIFFYLVPIVMFLVWRIFVFKSSREITDFGWVALNFYHNPDWWFRLPMEFFISFLHTAVFAYFLPIIVNLLRIPILASFLIICFGLFVSFRFFSFIRKFPYAIPRLIAKKIFLIGLITIVGTLFPILLSGRVVRDYSVYDRYTYTAMVGVSLALTGLLFYKLQINKRRLLVTALIFLSLTSHLLNGFYRLKVWQTEKNIWWQLSWRAPQIKKNSFLLLYFPTLAKNNFQNNIVNQIRWHQTYWIDYQVWATANFFLNYNKPVAEHLQGGLLSNTSTTTKLTERQIDTITDRGLIYQNNYQNSIIVSTPNDRSCLWVIDSVRQETPEGDNPLLEKYLNYSNINLLATSEISSTPPKTIFGKEPRKTWCYYFQKASLLRQQQNWNELLKITDEVINSSYRPGDPNEWLPFLEGLVVNKKFIEAETLIKTILTNDNTDHSFSSNYCKMLDRLKIEEIKC